MFTKMATILKLIERNGSKFYTTILKSVTGSGKFGPGRFITDIGSTSKKNNFLFYEPQS